MKEIAYIPLTPLGDVLCGINDLVEIHRLYDPCKITVFAIPLIAELFRNYKYCDDVVVCPKEKIYEFQAPDTTFDIVFNLGYDMDWISLQRKLKHRKAYGAESLFISADVCKKEFDKWVPLDYWNNVTLKVRKTVASQMAETLRLVNPEYDIVHPVLTKLDFYMEWHRDPLPDQYVLILPGTSALYKYFPIQKYLEIADVLKENEIPVIFVSGPQDSIVESPVRQSENLYYNDLSLSELAFIVTHASTVIGNDSGPMHFAAAFDVRSIHIFSTNSAFNWFQYNQKKHRLVMPKCANEMQCKSCAHICMAKIGIRSVLDILASDFNFSYRLNQIAVFVEDHIGDSLMYINSLEHLAKIYSPCECTVFAPSSTYEIYKNYAFADKMIEYSEKDWEKISIPQEHYKAVFNQRYDVESMKTIQKMNYEHAYGYENFGGKKEDFIKLYDKYIPFDFWDDYDRRWNTSVCEQKNELIRLVDPMYHLRYPILTEQTFVLTRFQKRIQRKMVVIIPGGSSYEKKWSIDSYIQLAQDLRKIGKYPLFLLGPLENEYMNKIENYSIPYLSGLSWSEIGYILRLSRCILAIGNDCGIMQFASSVDCPTITLFFNNNQQIWHPYNLERHKVLYPACANYKNCIKCQQKCTEKISYEKVWDEVQKY